MITALKSTLFFYKILNVTELTNIISGGIYRGEKPKNSELEDVVINSLPLASGKTKEVQNGIININCYSKNINGVANIQRLELISNKVIELLDNFSQGETPLNFEIIETHTLKELQQNSMSFVNIKINIHYL